MLWLIDFFLLLNRAYFWRQKKLNEIQNGKLPIILLIGTYFLIKMKNCYKGCIPWYVICDNKRTTSHVGISWNLDQSDLKTNLQHQFSITPSPTILNGKKIPKKLRKNTLFRQEIRFRAIFVPIKKFIKSHPNSPVPVSDSIEIFRRKKKAPE